MSKESFKQPTKKESPNKEIKGKLDKAEKVVEEDNKELKIEKIKIIEKSVKELKKLWEKNEGKIKEKSLNKTVSSISSLPLPEVPPSCLEEISNRFIREFDWEKFKWRVNLSGDLGLFLSVFFRKNIEKYILYQEREGIKEKDIKPVEVRLKIGEVPIITFDLLGYQNPEKLHLIIEGGCGSQIGYKMQGGKIIVKDDCELFYSIGEKMQGGEIIIEGNCGKWTGQEMQGGKIIVKGDCRDCTGKEMRGGEIIIEGNCGDWAGQEMQGGKIIVEGNCGKWTGQEMRGGEIIVKGNCGSYAGKEMQGGKIVVEGNCWEWIGEYMKGGELNIKGKVILFHSGVFTPNNKGTVVLGGKKIFEKGKLTLEGKKIYDDEILSRWEWEVKKRNFY